MVYELVEFNNGDVAGLPPPEWGFDQSFGGLKLGMYFSGGGKRLAI